MNVREIIPLKQSLDLSLTLPGSKSITNRAFLCAALAKGTSTLTGALESDDTAVMLSALERLGVKHYESGGGMVIEGCGGEFKKGDFTFDLHNAGTATRFLTAVMAVREGYTTITGDKRMQERPIGDLVDGLRQIGVEVEYLKKNGYPPFRIQDSRFNIKESFFLARMKGDKSSQYFSALLMMGSLLPKPLKIEVVGELVSKPYIDTTIAVMKAFGVKVKNNHYRSFEIKPQTYKACDYWIEGDASAASYWISMAYLHRGKVGFSNLRLPKLSKKLVHTDFLASESYNLNKLSKKSIQGDALYGQIIKKLKKNRSKLITQSSLLEIDMGDMPDVAMTLSCTAPFVEGDIKITGLSTLRIKETDRLAALEKELEKIGVKVKITKNSLLTEGWTMSSSLRDGGSVIINTYNDHRMAMCFAVIGTKIPGLVIENPDCVKKTYPSFWEDLERMYLSQKIRLGDKNLVLTGMRASGKSYLGKRIAAILGRKFVDIDEMIERSEGLMVAEIVKQKGWEIFRKTEQKICSKYYESKQLVISTGGGAILNPANMKALKKNGVNVFIFADPTVLSQRILKQGNRPSLTGSKPEDEVGDVWLARRDLYLKYADYVWDNTSGKIVEKGIERVFS